MKLGIFQRPTVGLKSFRVKHGGLDKIFNSKLNSFISPLDINLKVKPLEMIFRVRIRFHKHLILGTFNARDDFHIARLKLGLKY